MFTPFIHFKMLSMSLFPGSVIFLTLPYNPFTPLPPLFLMLSLIYSDTESLTEGENEGIYARSNLSKPT